ncbi:hypothetical protein ACGFZQ_51170 [Streptomyces sp. NPDC048254]|uniref:hypothetical protein n=1 Tax=Streptomyces sp. NPDC048254 TaxID=3365525 RepID=UPI0037142CE6
MTRENYGDEFSQVNTHSTEKPQLSNPPLPFAAPVPGQWQIGNLPALVVIDVGYAVTALPQA